MNKNDIHQFMKVIASKVDERRNGTEEWHNMNFNVHIIATIYETNIIIC